MKIKKKKKEKQNKTMYILEEENIRQNVAGKVHLSCVVLQQEDDGEKGKSNWRFQNLVCKNYARHLSHHSSQKGFNKKALY